MTYPTRRPGAIVTSTGTSSTVASSYRWLGARSRWSTTRYPSPYERPAARARTRSAPRVGEVAATATRTPTRTASPVRPSSTGCAAAVEAQPAGGSTSTTAATGSGALDTTSTTIVTESVPGVTTTARAAGSTESAGLTTRGWRAVPYGASGAIVRTGAETSIVSPAYVTLATARAGGRDSPRWISLESRTE